MGKLLRIVLKAAALFALCNLLFAAVQPMDALARLSLYNTVLPGRDRLPYGENPAQSYNLSLNNLPAMFASHVISRPKADDEYRVLLLGDSGTWGWYQRADETLAAHLNALDLRTTDGRRMVFYNLGYPIMALLKDVLLLDEALRYEPDAVVWLVTLASFPNDKQLFPPLVQDNAPRVRSLIDRYDLQIDPEDARLHTPSFVDETIIGQRRALADLLRLQSYSFAWAATGIDQFIPADIPLRQSDFDTDVTWEGMTPPVTMTDVLAFDVLTAGIAATGDLPLLIVNEPMFISSGRNSDLHYNSFYPRWAYDAYRQALGEFTQARGLPYVDLWDAIPAAEFTDSPVHLTRAGAAQLAGVLRELILEALC